MWRIENGAKRYNTPVITGTTAILIHSKASRRGPGLHVFDLATTPPVQRLTIKANGATSSPASDGTWVWWSDADGAHCASLKDGSRRWDNTDITMNTFSSSVVCGHALILSHRKNECWYIVDTETGKLRHQQDIDDKLIGKGGTGYATPAVADGFVVIKGQASLIGYDLRP